MLRKIGIGWEFENEALLENFLRRYLQALLGLNAIAQQYAISGQICDLVAISDTGQLAILELKNQEDRYITQQITRYFDAFLGAKPFADVADYKQPIRLLAIAPTFHCDSFTDRKYSVLNIEFLTFNVTWKKQHPILKLQHLDSGACSEVTLPERSTAALVEVASPPKSLLPMLAKCSPEEQEGVLAVRQQILSFSQRLREIVCRGSILYGNGKTNPCAELRYDSKRSRMVLFLWLPHRASQQMIVARLRIWTDWHTVSDLAHIPKALGGTITVDEWLDGNLTPLKKVIPHNALAQERYRQDANWRSEFINGHRGNRAVARHQSGIAMTLELYRTMIEQPNLSSRLIALTNLALETWQSRI